MGRLAEGRVEQAMEMKGRETGFAGGYRKATGKLRKNFVISHQSFATMRRVSFNMHPWPYVKFM